jgi:hypothetical protein
MGEVQSLRSQLIVVLASKCCVLIWNEVIDRYFCLGIMNLGRLF